jgi:hypothetical protein
VLVTPPAAACGKYGKCGKFSASFMGEEQISRMNVAVITPTTEFNG